MFGLFFDLTIPDLISLLVFVFLSNLVPSVKVNVFCFNDFNDFCRLFVLWSVISDLGEAAGGAVCR